MDVSCNDCMGTLDIDGIPFDNAPAWCAYDLSDLWRVPVRRGANIIIPGATGRIARGFFDDELPCLVPMVFSGDWDETGIATFDWQSGLSDLLDYFVDNVVAKPGTVGEVRTATFTKPSGQAFTGDVQVRGWTPKFFSHGARVAVQLVFPAGVVAAGTVGGS